MGDDWLPGTRGGAGPGNHYIEPASESVGLADVAAGAGDLEWARTLAEQAEAAAQAITDPNQQAETMADLAEAAAGIGDLDRAERLAEAIADSFHRARALGVTAEAAAEASDLDRAESLVEQAEVVARTITGRSRGAQMMASLAQTAARVDLDRGKSPAEYASTAARAIAAPDNRAQVMVGTGEAAPAASDLDRAEVAARTIFDLFGGRRRWPAWRRRRRAQVCLTEPSR